MQKLFNNDIFMDVQNIEYSAHVYAQCNEDTMQASLSNQVWKRVKTVAGINFNALFSL